MKIKMNYKIINKKFPKLIASTFNSGSDFYKFENGFIYTLYSDRFNLIKIGFARNNKILENKLSSKEFTLLEKKKGKNSELNLIIDTLDELGIKFSGNFNYEYSHYLMKYLSILGWPIGHSLYKNRKIKKELSCA